jgi:serine/threonine-protein kinase HipA
MKLAAGTPLVISLMTDLNEVPIPVARLVMVKGVAQLEWRREVLARGLSVSPLHYSLETGLHPARKPDLFDGLHGFLADSLPDAWGTLLLRRYVQRVGLDFDRFSSADRLAMVGRRGRGALIFEPESLLSSAQDRIDLDALASEARLVLAGDVSELDDVMLRLGGGSGGARPKVHISMSADGRLAPEGEADSEWIVKFPALNDPIDIGPVEEAYARMARAAGISMAETRLLPSAHGPGHFATRRFDRPSAGQRLHMVSLGGAVEASPSMPSLDYDGFLSATLSITRDVRDVEQAFRRMLFNILAHNRDDHVRQQSYLMDALEEWRLAPAYDLTFANGPGGEHYMAVMGEGRAITRAHIEALGARHGIAPKRIATIVDHVRAAVSDWRHYAQDTGVSETANEIGDRIAVIDLRFQD